MNNNDVNNWNILIVDDESATITAVSYIFKRAGHKVASAHDGQEALEILKQHPDEFQVLITDHAMQKVSGLELVEKLHQTTFHGKIILLSAYMTEDLESSYRKHGVQYFITKPFDLMELRNAVALSA